ncbi:PREDICTED: histone acetyltransferase MCC1-like [Nelumbo nucifera]|uniref:N-alpha-acetyltransferase 60 n=1 Tax=Nelumbo nucifera TaxID=4432 RepID=A0A1U8BJC0_NELNU|nr:PREDICTED: histone acetyltransferase MCC1-like [Nelumbo nucifera]XP_010276867.1 PREDICTED: histone acetyltransferase MCC1-like [Nelumbo nucifera]XP_010276868.1 PREDICTED: histone acetyltransferase MCC1-like [Nelumbo nucifera]
MVDPKAQLCPNIVYRPIMPSDLEVLEQIHADLFPIRYESEFFLNVVNGYDIVSWGAVDRNRPGCQSDELIGFVTTRTIPAKESEIADMLRCDSSRTDQTLVYILTLGVVESYRSLGIATSLIREVIKYASNIPTCRAVYLHVIAYNDPAIRFYQKMMFKCIQRLSNFYYIKGQHYDSYLFLYYINGGRSPCSPLELVTALATYVRSLFKSLTAKIWKKEEKKVPRWFKCKDTSCLLVTQNKRIITTDSTGFQCV